MRWLEKVFGKVAVSDVSEARATNNAFLVRGAGMRDRCELDAT